jgi:FixJ family two-component response regulator
LETALEDETKILIYVVDDDASVRQALEMLFISADMEVQTFEWAEDFLEYEFREEKACLITDIKMKGLSGFELQQQLNERGIKLPVIFLTAFDSTESRQQARQAGAAGYFRKPVDDQALLDIIQWALSHHSSSKEQITTQQLDNL